MTTKDMADRDGEAGLLLRHPPRSAVGDALAGPANDLPAHAAALASALGWHLKHEEDAALPLIQAVCPARNAVA